MFRYVLARILYMWGSLHRNFGNASNFQREHRAAVHRFSQAYDMDPSFREARLSRAIILYREMGRPDQAMLDLNALLVDDPDYAPALLNRALVRQERGEYVAALEDLDHYLRLPKEDEEYWRMASRTADLLREIVDELADGAEGEQGLDSAEPASQL